MDEQSERWWSAGGGVRRSPSDPRRGAEAPVHGPPSPQHARPPLTIALAVDPRPDAAGRAQSGLSRPSEAEAGAIGGDTRSPDGVDLVVPDERPSWEEVAERYGDTVYTMAFRLTGDRDEARDLAQDVFVRVYRNLDRYRPGTFEGWLYRITKNLFLDRMRRRARVRMEPLPDEEWRQPAEAGPGPAERVDATVLRGDVESALAALPATFRTAVVLCDIQGLSYEEISDATGWPLGTVRSRIHRGRRLLRGALGDPRPPDETDDTPRRGADSDRGVGGRRG